MDVQDFAPPQIVQVPQSNIQKKTAVLMDPSSVFIVLNFPR